jgi:Inactive homolog of metal-dependent proteases, putative molecular chaperone
MTIAFDTTERGAVRVRLHDGKKEVRRTRKMFADALLYFVAGLVKKNHPDLIAVVNGPGGFSATRNGVAIGNALAYGWNVPIAAITKEQFDSRAPLPRKGLASIAVVYGSEPNITKKKMRL